jgi:hypothetical protein
MMVSWRVNYPPGFLWDIGLKERLVHGITAEYEREGIHAMHVTVVFVAVGTDDLWIGGISSSALDIGQFLRVRDAGQGDGEWAPNDLRPFIRLNAEHHWYFLTQGETWNQRIQERLHAVR